jgi:hypothetical protein
MSSRRHTSSSRPMETSLGVHGSLCTLPSHHCNEHDPFCGFTFGTMAPTMAAPSCGMTRSSPYTPGHHHTTLAKTCRSALDTSTMMLVPWGGGYHMVSHPTPYNMGGDTHQSLIQPTQSHMGGGQSFSNGSHSIPSVAPSVPSFVQVSTPSSVRSSSSHHRSGDSQAPVPQAVYQARGYYHVHVSQAASQAPVYQDVLPEDV